MPVYLFADTGYLYDVTVRFDFTGLAGMAQPQAYHDCTVTGEVATCSFEALMMVRGRFDFPWLLNVTPVAGAPAGSRGNLVVTVTAAGFPAASHTASVTAGVPVGFGVYAGWSVEPTLRAGQALSVPFAVRAEQGAAIHGAVLTFDLPPLLRKADNFGNCRYLPSGPVACMFDTILQPLSGTPG